MRKIILLLIFILLPFFSLSCFTHEHTIGGGPHVGKDEEVHQWYALWGAITISDKKDGGAIAGTDSCKIITEFTPLDCLINFFTGVVSIYRSTIIIKK